LFKISAKLKTLPNPNAGEVDMKAFFKVLREVDFDGWAIVEQDMYPAPFHKPSPIAKRTIEYLGQLKEAFAESIPIVKK
jgi:sugar phosphate isomerase/epimerase